jgi:CheY-like chemotaxis protein
MAAGDYVLLAVSDTGIGMDAATLRRIFEPFFTTKEQGKGTGLGLAMVYGIVKQSGGFIWAYSEPGEGATFKVYLPRVAAESIAEQAASPVLTGGTETILLVEDEEAVRALADEFLQAAGYTVLQAAGPAEALDLCVRHEGPIHLLLTDVVMPGMRGPELAERILALHPGTRVLFFSGYTDEAVVHHGILNRGVAFVEKPLLRSALVQRVRETLDRPQFATSQSVPE